MITLKEWMEVVDYRITEGDQYYTGLFGNDASCYCLSAWNGDHDGYSFSIVFDTNTQVVYSVEACDYKNERAYRLINSDFSTAFHKNSHVYDNQAWDSVNFIDLDVDDDWIQKALAIKSGKQYDTRVQVPLELDDSEMFKLMTLAHERDITLNQLVAEILWDQIKKHDESKL
jgi:hypothetical protein